VDGPGIQTGIGAGRATRIAAACRQAGESVMQGCPVASPIGTGGRDQPSAPSGRVSRPLTVAACSLLGGIDRPLSQSGVDRVEDLQDKQLDVARLVDEGINSVRVLVGRSVAPNRRSAGAGWLCDEGGEERAEVGGGE
jgi:hypothetical protein